MPDALIDKAFAFIANVGEGLILLILSDNIISSLRAAGHKTSPPFYLTKGSQVNMNSKSPAAPEQPGSRTAVSTRTKD
jgi:hypothetical protein